MSAENCPFELKRPDRSEEERRKDQFVSFESPIDPDDPDGPKTMIEVRKLASTEPEDVLAFWSNFDELVDDLGAAEGQPRFRLVTRLMTGTPKDDWEIVVNECENRDQVTFDACREEFLLQCMDREVALDTEEWLQSLKKPRNQTVKSFVNDVRRFNELIDVMPAPTEDDAERVPSFTEAESSVILRKCGPRSWAETQTKARLHNLNLNDQAQHCETLRRMEQRGDKGSTDNNRRNNNRNRRNNGRNARRDQNNDQNRDTRNRNQNNRGQTCPIHGVVHPNGQECNVIHRERENHERNRANRNAPNQQDNSRNEPTHRHPTRSRTRNVENNNVDSKASRSASNDVNSVASDDVNDVFEDVTSLLDDSIESEVEDNLTTEARVQMIDTHSGMHKFRVASLDTGANRNFVKRSALRGIPHKIRKCNVPVKGRYSAVGLREIATLTLKFPDFASSKKVSVDACVEDKAAGKHDIVIGRKTATEMGLVFDFWHQTITWDDVTLSMRSKGSFDQVEVNAIHPGDAELPKFFQNAINRQVRGMTSNAHDKHNCRDMVLRCKHLDDDQQHQLIELFGRCPQLFDGTLGAAPGKPVHLTLKPGSHPCCAKACTVPQALCPMARKEVDELEKIDVIMRKLHSPWGAPCLLRSKKSGGIRFLSDLRKLNECLERHPCPLPVVDDVAWKMNGFTCATCLDLNRGCCHFVLDDESKKLCGIILPWGKHCHNRLPQGIKPASDIFQACMTDIFHDMEDIIVCIDNIILFAKNDFNHHCQRLELVLQRLLANNLHAHVKESHLAAKTVDCLGCAMTAKGIQPQKKKIPPLLRFARPQNRQQLRGFIGFVNCYKKLWHRRSHTLMPLTALSSDKVKFKWTDVHTEAFNQMKKIMAREILLRFPDFSQPFKICPDASDCQLGAVIAQEFDDGEWPIAFYSRKLSQAQ